jgi:hypothetical protein
MNEEDQDEVQDEIQLSGVRFLAQEDQDEVQVDQVPDEQELVSQLIWEVL